MTGLDNLANPPPANDKAATAPGATIKGSIDIAPALKSRLAATDVLFSVRAAGTEWPPRGGRPCQRQPASAGI